MTQSLTARINHFFQHRSEPERVAFERLRRGLSLPSVLARRSAARAIAGEARFRIDPDRGFTLFPPGTFAEAAEVVEATAGLERGVDLNRPGLSRKAKAGFMVPTLDPAALDLSSPLLRLALRPDVIAAVADYLGLVPVLAHLNVYYSSDVAEEARQSQLFHCDADATRQVKMFVLCSEVTAASGPLTLLDARTSATARRGLNYRFGRKIKDAAMQRRIRDAEQYPVVGPAGTVCFVDTTRCFHFGSRVERGAPPRLVAMLQYLPPGSFMLPRDHRQGAPFRGLADGSHTRAQRMVLGAE